MQDVHPILLRYSPETSVLPRNNRELVRVEKLGAERESSHHCIRLAIDGTSFLNGNPMDQSYDLVLSPAGAVTLIRSVRTALQEYLGYDPTDDRQSS